MNTMIFTRSNIVKKQFTLVVVLLVMISLVSAITLDEAKQIALGNNSKYRAQKEAYESAKWSKQQALGSMLPSLSLSGTYVYLDPAVTARNSMGAPVTYNHDSRTLAINASQPLFMGGKLWQAYKINGITAEINRLSLENTRLSIVNEVESKYLSVLQMQELLSISEKDLASSVNNQAIAKVRYEGGTLSSVDYLKIQAKTASKEVALIQSQTALELAKQDLMNTLGVTEITGLTPVSTESEIANIDRISGLSPEMTAAFTENAIRLSGSQNLSMKTAFAATELSKKTYNIAKGSFLPTIVLSASRSLNDTGTDRYEFSGTNTIALSASVPLLPFWNTYSGARKAWYDYQKSRADYQTASDGITLGVKANALSLISSARQYKAAGIALKYTEQTYQQLMERFRNNMLSTNDMLDAEVMLQSASVSNTNAYFSYLKAKSALLQVLGVDNANVIDTLIK